MYVQMRMALIQSCTSQPLSKRATAGRALTVTETSDARVDIVEAEQLHPAWSGGGGRSASGSLTPRAMSSRAAEAWRVWRLDG